MTKYDEIYLVLLLINVSRVNILCFTGYKTICWVLMFHVKHYLVLLNLLHEKSIDVSRETSILINVVLLIYFLLQKQQLVFCHLHQFF